ncbi:MAG: PocR ligand-binding domain-containing protein [Propionicimonas sp.]
MADNAISAVLDVDQIQVVLQDFSEATGLATVAADARGLPITPACAFTDFCQTMRSDPLRNQLCHGCDAHGGLQSMIEDGPRVYRCHAGLVDFSVPLTDGDTYLGAILCGQVRVTSQEQPDFITRQTPWRGERLLEELYDEVPVSNLSRVAAAAKMLLGLSSGIEGLKRRRGRRELPVIQPAPAPRPVASARPSAARVLHDHLDAEDLAGGYAQLTRLLDEIFDGPGDLREALAELDDQLIEVAADCSPRAVPHLTAMVKRQRTRRTSAPSRYQTQLYYERILAMVLDELRRSRPHRQRDLRDLLNDIARHPNRALSLTEAAAAAHWSPGHLSKVFKSVTGYTFVSYVTLWRLSRAQLMLASTQMPVQQIASELDFQQVNYFSRVFRSYTGVSPSEYRRRSVSREGRPAGVSLPTHHHALLRA